MNTGQTNSTILSSDDFRLEYAHLREEILHNNHLTCKYF